MWRSLEGSGAGCQLDVCSVSFIAFAVSRDVNVASFVSQSVLTARLCQKRRALDIVKLMHVSDRL